MPRKIVKTILILIIISLSLLPLSAEGWRYCVGGEDESYVEILSSVLSSLGYVENENALFKIEERELNKRTIERNKRIGSYLEKEDFESIKKVEEVKQIEINRAQMEEVSLDLSIWNTFLHDGDEDANSYLLLKNDLDALFYVSSSGSGAIRDLTLYLNGEKIREISFISSLSSYEEDALFTLFSEMLLGHDSHVYKMSITPEFATLTIDGEIRTTQSPYVVLKDGEHSFSLSAYSYESREFSFNLDGTVKELELTLEKEIPHSLYISSEPWNSEIRVNGEKIDEKYVKEIHSPYIISLESEGFIPTTFQTSSRDEVIKVALNPQWKEEKNILEEKKNEFYKSIFTTLISFGGYTALRAVENIESSTLMNSAKVVFGGISIVSLINLVRAASIYYDAAGTSK